MTHQKIMLFNKTYVTDCPQLHVINIINGRSKGLMEINIVPAHKLVFILSRPFARKHVLSFSLQLTKLSIIQNKSM